MSKQSTPNPILVIYKVREIPEFTDAISKIKNDKLWVEYYNRDDSLKLSRDWFLEHKEYTHFVILPDDLIITQESFDTLKEDSKSHDVISGWCQNTIRLTSFYQGPPETEDNKDTNISIDYLPPEVPHLSRYEDYHFTPVRDVLALIPNIITVKFAGFPLPFISRKVIEQVPFRSDQGCCSDACFSTDLHKNNIPQFVDTMARTIHLNKPYELLEVGKRESQLVFEPAV